MAATTNNTMTPTNTMETISAISVLRDTPPFGSPYFDSQFVGINNFQQYGGVGHGVRDY